MRFTKESERQALNRRDLELPGAMRYGASRDEAIVRAEARVLHVLAER